MLQGVQTASDEGRATLKAQRSWTAGMPPACPFWKNTTRPSRSAFAA